MKTTIIEIFYKKGVFDATAEIVNRGIIDFGIDGVRSVKVSRLYKIENSLTIVEMRFLCENLLIDPIVQSFLINSKLSKTDGHSIQVWYKPGVTDAVGKSVLKASRDMGIKGIDKVSTGSKYIISGKLKQEDIKRICGRLLVNSVIQTYEVK
jgi:phosphoribosylformylglycinamidine (FGAM) synthase PurS component